MKKRGKNWQKNGKKRGTKGRNRKIGKKWEETGRKEKEKKREIMKNGKKCEETRRN